MQQNKYLQSKREQCIGCKADAQGCQLSRENNTGCYFTLDYWNNMLLSFYGQIHAPKNGSLCPEALQGPIPKSIRRES